MTGSELLHNARELVEQGWCQGAEARDARGAETDVASSSAAAWSLLGALQATTVSDPSTQLQDVGDAVAALAELIADPSLADWNDSEVRTKLEVLRVLQEAELLAVEEFLYHKVYDN
jgi:hypothetical protein